MAGDLISYDEFFNRRGKTPNITQKLDSKSQEFDDFFTRRQANHETSLRVGSESNPDDTAKAIGLADKTGLPVTTVERNLDVVERDTKNAASVLALEDRPAASRFLSDPENAKLAHDDVSNLANIEDVLGRFGPGYIPQPSEKNIVGNIVAGMGEHVFDFFKSGNEAVDIITKWMNAPFREINTLLGIENLPEKGLATSIMDVVDAFEIAAGVRDAGAVSTADMPPKKFGYEQITTWEDFKQSPVQSFLPFALEQGLVSAPEMAALIFAMPMVLLSRSGRIAADRAVSDEREDATMSDLMTALPYALSSVLLDRWSAKGVFGIDDTMKKTGVLAVTGATLKAGGKELATEGAQEGIESTGATLGTERGFNLSNTLEAMAQGAVTGLGFGASVRSATATIESVVKSKQAKENRDLFEAMGQSAEASKLRERLPAKYRDFIERVTENGAVKDIFIDPEPLMTLMQTNPDAIEEMSLKIGIDLGERVEEAGRLGHAVTIPLADYQTYIAGTDVGLELMDDIKFAETDMTVNEAARSVDEVNILFEEARSTTEAEEPFDRAADKVRDKMISAGMNPSDATTSVEVIRGNAKVLQEEYGVDPEEYFGRLEIKGFVPEGLAAPVESIDLIIDRARRGTIASDQRLFGESLKELARRMGVKDDQRGDLRGIDENLAPFQRKMIREDGSQIDDVLEAAVKAGFFPEVAGDRAKMSIADFMEALTGEERFIEGAGDAAEAARVGAANDLIETLSRLGVDLDASNDEIKAALQEAAAVEGGVELEQTDIESGAFKDWFGDSKVVDDAGAPLVVFHGTDVNFGEFKTGPFDRRTALSTKPKAGNEFFFTENQGMAEEFGHKVLPVYLSLQNPLVVDAKTDSGKSVFGFIDEARVSGHDGVIVLNVFEGANFPLHSQIVAFEPTQIKSINNRGTFNPNDPRILFQDEEVSDPEAMARIEETNRASIESMKRTLRLYEEGRKRPDPDEPRTLFQPELAPPFFSALTTTVESFTQPKAPGKQWAAMINKAPGVKPAEIAWSGVVEWLNKQEGSVSKEDLVAFVRASQVEIQEVTKSGGPVGSLSDVELLEALDDSEVSEDQGGPTKFATYTLPGGENYRELLLTLPTATVGTPPAAITELPDGYDVIRDTSSPEGEQFGVTPPEQTHGRPMAGRHPDSETAAAAAIDWINRNNLSRFDEDQRVKDFTGGHYDEANVLAHIRFNERTDADGNRVLFIEEIQSDWHQMGRKRGYDGSFDVGVREDENVWVVTRADGKFGDVSKREAATAEDAQAFADTHPEIFVFNATRKGVPDAPFKKTWHELAFRRMVRYAADNGFDSVAWTTGEQQADRYDLSQHLDSIQYEPNFTENGDQTDNYDFVAYAPDGSKVIEEEEITLDRISEIAGKEIAQKIENEEGESMAEERPLRPAWMKLSGLDLKVGGEGMKGFYDKILPAYANKFGKKFGSKVEKIKIENPEEAAALKELRRGDPSFVGDEASAAPTVHSLPITDEMRETAKSGFPLFQPERGSIQFFDDKTIINLGKSADLSTFLHESAHLFVNTLATIASTNERAAADLTLMMNFAGVETLEGFNSVEAQEKLARGFEAYLREGKAPSVALQGAFSRFRSWLIQIYKTLLKLDVELNDSIRSVFDRMLATDAEIVEAEQVNQFMSMDGIAELMPDEGAAYIEAGQRAHDKAVERLLKAKIKEDVREETARWRDEYERVLVETTAGIDGQPVYRALDEIRGRDNDVFLSRGAIEDMLGVEGVKRLPKGLTRKEDGVHPDVVAEQFGFTSGDEMLFALMNAEPTKAKRKKLGEDLSLELMRERHGSLDENQAQAAEAAGEAVMNDDRGLFLAMELNALQVNSGEQPTSAAVAKAAAQRILGEKNLGEAMQTGRYTQAAAKAGRDANRALQKNDILTAREAKMRQILNYYLARESKDISDSIGGKLDRLRRWQTKPMKAVHPLFVKEVKALLSELHFGQKIGQKKTDRLIFEAFEAFQKKVEGDDEFAGVRFHIPPELEAALSRRNYKDMTLAEFDGLHDTAKSIVTQGRRYSEAEKAQFNSLVAGIADSIEANAKKTRVDKIERGLLDKLGDFGRLALAEHRFISSLSDELDGFSGFGGQVHRNTYLRIKQADDKYTDRSMRAAESINEILSVYSLKEKIQFMSRTFIPAMNKSLSLNARLAFALNMGNEGNVEAIRNEYTPAEIEGVLSTLTNKDWDVVEALWKHIDSYWGDLSALEERMVGVKPEKVEAIPFTRLVDGKQREISGGYYPLVGDPSRSETAKQDLEDRVSLDGFLSGGHAKATTKHGSTIERTGWGRKRKIWLDLSVAFGHVDGVIKDIELREAVVETHRIINHPLFEAEVKASKGRQYHQMFNKWLENVIGVNRPQTTAWESAIQYARTGASIAEMGFSLRTMFLQPFGITQSIVLIGEVNVLRGMAEFATNRSLAARQVMEMSSFMRNRGATFNRDVRDAQRLMGVKGLHERVVSASFWGIQQLDLAVSIPTWLGAHGKALREGMSQQDAIDFADEMVARSQGTGMPRDMSDIQQGGPLKRMFVMFYSFFSSYHNLQADQWKRTNFRSPTQALKWAKNQVWMTLIPAVLADFIFNQRPDDDDWWVLESLIKFVGGGVVILRDAVNAYVTNYGFQGSPAFGMPKHLLSSATQIKQGENDAKLWKSLILSLGYAGHMPGARAMARAVDVIDDEGTRNLDEFETWWRVLVTGKKK